ncbi:MAG: alpha/beta hydrolase [Erysipelotrichaceae bacterium]|nr:alpha/beta hydrolase [Erysipelotrichaceae bacterium]
MKEIIKINSTYDQQPLYASLFYDDQAKKGIIQVFHGMAEHRHRYDWFASQLLQAGYVVLTCDNRGHGDSAVTLGYFADQNGWQVNLNDLYQLTMLVKKRFDLPLIIFGHSMGTLIARSFLKQHEDIVEGMILSGSPSENNALVAATLIAKTIKTFRGAKHQSALLNNLSFGSFNKHISNPRTEFDWLSCNEENVDSYINDKWCGYPFTVQGYLDLFDGLKDVYQARDWHVRKPDLPIKFFSGENDPCMGSVEGLKAAVQKLQAVGYQKVEYEILPGLRHEILNEKERMQVLHKIIGFIEEK